jgi:hypothetical protein
VSVGKRNEGSGMNCGFDTGTGLMVGLMLLATALQMLLS